MLDRIDNLRAFAFAMTIGVLILFFSLGVVMLAEADVSNQIPGTIPEDDPFSMDRFYRDGNSNLLFSTHLFENFTLSEIQWIERDDLGSETVRRTATIAEQNLYLQQKSDRINQIAQAAASDEFSLPPQVGINWNTWADNSVSQLTICADQMATAVAGWPGWGVNARDTAMVTTFGCLDYAFGRQAIVIDRLRDLLIAQGVIVVD